MAIGKQLAGCMPMAGALPHSVVHVEGGNTATYTAACQSRTCSMGDVARYDGAYVHLLQQYCEHVSTAHSM